jgi:hypothetical protein
MKGGHLQLHVAVLLAAPQRVELGLGMRQLKLQLLVARDDIPVACFRLK